MVHLFYIIVLCSVFYYVFALINKQRTLIKLIKELSTLNEKLLQELEKEKQERETAQEELKNFIDTFDSTLMKEEEIREQVLQDFQSEVEAILLKDMIRRMKNVGEA
jgi:chromosome condensin MukBEF ATPase and DNA-binding subunit MukB